MTPEETRFVLALAERIFLAHEVLGRLAEKRPKGATMFFTPHLTCPFCKKIQQQQPDHNFCVNCGRSLNEPTCPHCNQSLAVDAAKAADAKRQTQGAAP